MRGRLIFGGAFAIGLAAIACNALTGAGDLGVCENAECDALGSSSGSDGDGGDPNGGEDGGADAALPQACNGDEKRCTGNVAAHCVGGKLETTTCPETCVDGDCMPFISCRTDAGAACGPDGGAGSCCETLAVPGGTFNRYDDDTKPATVSPFSLDKLEVTVARFRAFVEAGEGTLAKPPAAGAGANPKIANSGWNAEWNNPGAALLPADRPALEALLNGGTWTATPGANELRPITNVPWFVAFAFCAWDGGRLPTDAEWGFAASGGDEQRAYPWSDPKAATTIDTTFSAYDCAFDPPAYACAPVYGLRCNGAAGTVCTTQGALCPDNVNTCQKVQIATSCTGCTSPDDVAFVGSYPKGVGRYGHLDLAGNVAEWVLDASGDQGTIVLPAPCNDCATLVPSGPGGVAGGPSDDAWIIVRGGSWSSTNTDELLNSNRVASARPYGSRSLEVGFRCARN